MPPNEPLGMTAEREAEIVKKLGNVGTSMTDADHKALIRQLAELQSTVPYSDPQVPDLDAIEERFNDSSQARQIWVDFKALLVYARSLEARLAAAERDKTQHKEALTWAMENLDSREWNTYDHELRQRIVDMLTAPSARLSEPKEDGNGTI